MTYPTWMSDKGRQQMFEACRIAGINDGPIMISESRATVYNYAHENISTVVRITKPKIVAFVDIGKSQTTVTVAQYDLIDKSSRNIKGTVLY